MSAYQPLLSKQRDRVRKWQADQTKTDLRQANQLLAKRRCQNQVKIAASSRSDDSGTSAWLASIETRLAETAFVRQAEPNTAACLTESNLKAHPRLLLALLRQKREAIGRVWLLCRYIDKDGRGWLDLEVVQHHLTHKNSQLRIGGQRRLRQLLAAGEGQFWRRQKTGSGIRLWLTGIAQVASQLSLHQLKGKRIALPIDTLCSGIGHVRAAFYAAVYANRNHRNPIARATLQDLTDVPERTQRQYDALLNVERETNIAINGVVGNSAETETDHWQHRRAAFEFVDHQGQFGPEGGRYRARRLPNRYVCPFQPAGSRRIRKVQRQLQDLVTVGAQGNSDRQQMARLYYHDGNELAKANTVNMCYVRCTSAGVATIWALRAMPQA